MASRWFGIAIAAIAAFAPGSPGAQTLRAEVGQNIQERAQAALSLLSFSITPDATAGSLSINSASTGDPDITLGQVGAGFTVADSFPLYMEGFAGWNRYDPVFLVTDGTEQRALPTKWNSVSATIGLGWDFKLCDGLYLRPIVNASLAHLESDLSLGGRALGFLLDREIEFLDKGRLNVYGLGGSLMLDYGIYKEAYELDLELRYTWIHLQTYNTDKLPETDFDPMTVSLWGRYRWPSGLVLFRRPMRWVLEGALSSYVGEQRGSLGFNHLSSAGGGVELDFGHYSQIWTRTRFVGRYLVGKNVSGFSAGISITFF
jgi:hypothetical protein